MVAVKLRASQPFTQRQLLFLSPCCAIAPPDIGDFLLDETHCYVMQVLRTIGCRSRPPPLHLAPPFCISHSYFRRTRIFLDSLRTASPAAFLIWSPINATAHVWIDNRTGIATSGLPAAASEPASCPYASTQISSPPWGISNTHRVLLFGIHTQVPCTAHAQNRSLDVAQPCASRPPSAYTRSCFGVLPAAFQTVTRGRPSTGKFVSS